MQNLCNHYECKWLRVMAVEKRDYIQLSSYKLMCCVFDGLSMQPKSSNTIFMSSHLLMKPKKHILLHCIISYEVILLLL